ncbi:hypothetical protein BC826DRAFT_965415 [Russula brevipes]|nr:hypothetical protein BC826DRAFT_965415 [Russula brevipes]
MHASSRIGAWHYFRGMLSVVTTVTAIVHYMFVSATRSSSEVVTGGESPRAGGSDLMARRGGPCVHLYYLWRVVMSYYCQFLWRVLRYCALTMDGGKNPNGTTYRSHYVRNGLRRAAIQSTKHGSGLKIARRGTADRRDHHGQARNRNGRAQSMLLYGLPNIRPGGHVTTRLRVVDK